MMILFPMLIFIIENVTARIEFNRTSEFPSIRPEHLAELGSAYQVINRSLQVKRNSNITIECKAPDDTSAHWDNTLFFWKVHTLTGFKVFFIKNFRKHID